MKQSAIPGMHNLINEVRRPWNLGTTEPNAPVRVKRIVLLYQILGA
jgi:hypothetical protein